MSLTGRIFKLISPEEYLASEDDGSWRHEFINGSVYAMAGASARHNLIVSGVDSVLAGLVGNRCQIFSKDMKLRVATNNDLRFYYPDIFVTCDPTDRARHTRERPVLIVEVLSASTERIDRGEKFFACMQIPSLVEYGLLSQDQVELELFRRRTNWQREVYVHDNTVELESLNVVVMVSRLYERLGVREDGSLGEPDQDSQEVAV
jgi:Uma2 family endonuclease